MPYQGTEKYDGTTKTDSRWPEAKSKSSAKVQNAVEELSHLIHFNQSVSCDMAKTMQHLSDFMFVSMVNVTLCPCSTKGLNPDPVGDP